MMIVCATCGTMMRVERNGMKCHFGNGHVYEGDLWECRSCGARIVHTAPKPQNIDMPVVMSEYDVEMTEGRNDVKA